MNNLLTKIFIPIVLFLWAGQSFAVCKVGLYEHTEPGGKEIIISQSDFPNGIGQTFRAAPNQWERSLSIIDKTISGDFNYSTEDLIWIGGIAMNPQKAVLNAAGENTFGVRVGSLVYGDSYLNFCRFCLPATRLLAGVDAAGNIVGIDTGTQILTPEGLYDKTLAPSGWGPTDWNDEISSVAFHGDCEGASVTLYWDKEFGSPSDRPPLTLYPGTYSLNLKNHEPWNDDVSSYQVSFAAPPSIVLTGPEIVRILPGGTYTEPGAKAYNFEGNALTVIPGGTVGTAVGTYELSYTATDHKGISSKTYRSVVVTNWTEMYNILAKDIDVGADGTAWVAGTDGYVRRLGPAGWETVPGMGSVAKITVQPDGNAWVVQGGGGIYRWDPASGWVTIYGSLAHDAAIGADGSRWIVNDTDGVARFSDTNGWETMPGMGSVAHITVQPDGNAWVVQGQGGIYRWDPASGWVTIYGSLAHDAAIGADGSRWIVNDTDRVVRFSDTVGWEGMHEGLPGLAKKIAVDANGNAWVAMVDGKVFRWVE
ncbi:MAG: DUF5011 domain-containing protein [Candidatus Latescibacteria bacterium]|jgi:streptogramin lyase|nr:DUF5011 domain-containing protein [Gammaproteobacteria bacterium]MBT5876223.1 DUF5011 domain-containing protein [Candidatus Latescibacterota bacterium]MBT7371022.1 DUF5011 domain-containing protein [Gammaproteobacteria bacterium]